MKGSANAWAPYHGIEVVVLGASGFIGRRVARALWAQGAQLHMVVRNKAMAEKSFFPYGVQGTIFTVDLRDPEAMMKLLQKLHPSIIFNLVGYGVDRSERDEQIAYQVNGYLVKAICEAVTDRGDPAWKGQDLVHVGSAFEYGPIGGNLSEDSVPNPTTLYGKSKLMGTEFLARYCSPYGIKGVTARLFTVYGPEEHPGRLWPSLIDASRSQQPMRLTSGEQKRDFTYVDDVVEGLLRLGLATAEPGEVVNLATGHLTSVRSFTETAACILGIPRERLLFGSIPHHYVEMVHAEVGLGRLRQLTAWAPPTEIVEGMRKALDFEGLHRNKGEVK